jgi:hypothetical protein
MPGKFIRPAAARAGIPGGGDVPVPRDGMDEGRSTSI